MQADEAEHQRAQLRRALIASTIGTSIEWYDFFLYGSAAALVLNSQFFPQNDPSTGILLAFGTNFVGFIARPVGAAIFGHYGDRIGRKATLVMTLLLMGIGTFLVGLVPPYAVIGVWGGILLTVLRALQGIGVGGEWGGSVLLSMEWGQRSGRRGFIASWPQFGVPVGLLASIGMLALVTALTGPNFVTWGWRIPFLFSIVLVAVGLYIRLGVLETPVFTRLLEQRKVAPAPVAEVLQKNWREVLLTCLIRTGQQAPFYIFWTYVLVYATGALQLQRQEVLNDTLIASVVSLFTVPLWGHMSDIWGRRRTYMIGAAAMALFAWPYFALLDTRVPLLVLLAIVAAPVVHDIQYGPQAAFIAEAFPPRLRYSGASLGYHLASVTAGGPAPIIAAYLFAQFGSSFPIVVYIIICALISLWSAAVLPDRGKVDIDVEPETVPESATSFARV
ncbi:MAG: MHS family MFS transporter [Chloroflexi bacterium]|nr:MHS family MFS transporter [Chloroflexota bacterium]